MGRAKNDSDAHERSTLGRSSAAASALWAAVAACSFLISAASTATASPLRSPPWATAPIQQSCAGRPKCRVLGLALHMAQRATQADTDQRETHPVADDAFVARQLNAANRIFAPYGIAFRVAERHTRGPQHARMETRADRHALASYVRPKYINLFVVASLRDVDEPERMRRGVHWHANTAGREHYIILSKISFDAVLAHELGHFLGNPKHSQTRGNLMSYQHTLQLPFLDTEQVSRMRTRLTRYLKSGELTLLPNVKPPPQVKSVPSSEGPSKNVAEP